MALSVIPARRGAGFGQSLRIVTRTGPCTMSGRTGSERSINRRCAMSEKRKNPTRIIAIATGTNEVYDRMHSEARKEGLTLKAFILKRCLGIKPEPRGK